MDLYLLEELVASVVQYTDETGRPVAEPFKLLPSSEVGVSFMLILSF